jgi:hypothetical protein
MAIDDAAEQLEKERTDAGRLAEVRAADRRRALAEQQSQNEGRNRAPDLYNDKPAELLEQEYGMPTEGGAPAGEEQGETGEGEEERDFENEEREIRRKAGGRFGPPMAKGDNFRGRNERTAALQRAAAKKRQDLIRQSEKRSSELAKNLKTAQGKIDAQKKSKLVGCLLWCIPFFGWIAKIIQKIVTAKSEVEAGPAKLEKQHLKRQLEAVNKKLQSDLKKLQQQTALEMRKQK